MPDGKITLDDAAARAALARARARLTNLGPLMRELSGLLHDAVEENFAQEGRPRWEPLQASTVRQRRAKGTWPGKILQRRGQLAASIEPGAGREKAWAGTNLRYAAIQNFGGTVTIPARTQVIAVDEAAKRFLSRRAAGRRKKGFTAVRIAAIGAHTVTLPARPFLTLAESDWARITAAAERYLREER